MNNLIIVGNGFDLAHGLRTSYLDFMKYLVNSHCKDRSICSNLFNLPEAIDCYETLIKELNNNRETNQYGDDIPGIKVNLAKVLLHDFSLNNWSDIESRYFELLRIIGTKDSYYYYNAKSLNIDFGLLKQYLQDYLLTQQSLGDSLNSYESLFSSLSNNYSLILNFNYTDTVERLYKGETASSEILHIHGELNHNINPIIFGFAADNEDIKILVDKNDNEFLRNIKRHEYKRTNNEKRLTKYLDKTKDIRVTILGHSCGISDKLILEQILNHKNIHSIRILYYEDYESYFNSQINIYRIIRNNENFDKVVNFQDCCRMPQITDDQTKNFSYLNDFLDKMRDEYRKGIRHIPEIHVASF